MTTSDSIKIQTTVVEPNVVTKLHPVVQNDRITDYYIQKGDKIAELVITEIPDLTALTLAEKRKPAGAVCLQTLRNDPSFLDPSLLNDQEIIFFRKGG